MINLTLKNFQIDCIDYLFDKTTGTNKEKKIILQSPTGSGKTIILIAYIEKYFDYVDNTVFCWLTPGKGELEEQSKEKMKRFSPTSKTGDILDVLTSGFKTNTTYFINWETITKKGNKAVSESERNNLYDWIKQAHNRNVNFILIIDEEHQNNTSKADDVIKAISAEYEIRVSATPVKRAIGDFYEIKEVDVINEELITKAMYINKDLDKVQVKDIENETNILIEKADEVRKEILKAYKDENEDINPLVLIQFPNLNDKLIDRVVKKLDSMGYTLSNKMVAAWFSVETKEDRERKSMMLGKANIGEDGKENSITNNNALPCFLLFKQALATGWDCPRAKILVKLRENMSENFEIQTLGRLRRMPKAKHYGKDILDTSYLYTFDEKYKLAVINVGGYETQRVFLKEEAKKLRLVKEFTDRDSNQFDDDYDIRNKLYEHFITKYKLGTIKKANREILENNGFIFTDKLKQTALSGKAITLKELEDERKFDKVQIDYEVDTHIHGIELRQKLDMLKKQLHLPYQRTRAIFENLFRKGLGNEKYKIDNLTLKEFYAFIINNFDKIKDELNEFSSKRNRQQSLSWSKKKTQSFSIPTEEHYRFDSNFKNPRALNKNAYNDYNTSMIADTFRSTSEILFERYIEQKSNVKYIYKNGDVGVQYLSISYLTYTNKERLFYPDYIVVLEDESIWLVETKGGEYKGESKNIDIQVENKFQELQRFSKEHSYNFAFIRDKNGELYYNNTEYFDDMSNDNWKSIEEMF